MARLRLLPAEGLGSPHSLHTQVEGMSPSLPQSERGMLPFAPLGPVRSQISRFSGAVRVMLVTSAWLWACQPSGEERPEAKYLDVHQGPNLSRMSRLV